MHVEMVVAFNFFGGSDQMGGDNLFDASLEKLKSAKEEKWCHQRGFGSWGQGKCGLS